MEGIFGRSPLQTLGKCAFDVFPSLKETGEDRLFSEALAGKTASTGERLHIMPQTGEQRFFESHYSPLLAESVDIDRVAGRHDQADGCARRYPACLYRPDHAC